jgi:hypothetical protein
VEDAQILVHTCTSRGGRNDDEALRVRPFEDDLAGRAADSARDCPQDGVDRASGVRGDRPIWFDSETRQSLSDCRSQFVRGKDEGKGEIGTDRYSTYARVLYASVTMPCFVENSKASFHDA